MTKSTFQGDPTLPRDGTDLIATRLRDFARASSACRHNSQVIQSKQMGQ
jgi:hypothetical protein